MSDFQEWLRTACFQKPTIEAELLAMAAWEASKNHHSAEADVRMNDLLVAAFSWWRCRRPCDWGEGNHLANPTINTTTDAEKLLAIEVAKIVGN